VSKIFLGININKMDLNFTSIQSITA